MADETLNTDVEEIFEIREQAAFGWATIDLESLSLTPYTELPLSVASTGSFPDGDDQIIAVTAADFSTTTLTRVTREGVTPGVSLPGFFINGAARAAR